MFAEDWLFGGLGASKRVDAQEVLIQEEFGSDQTPDPTRVNDKGTAQELNSAVVIGATYEHHAADGVGLEIEAPGIGKGTPRRGGIDAENVSAPRGQDVAFGAFLEFGERGGLKAVDNFGLPEAIEGFDGGLKTGFAWRSEDGNDVESQTESDDASEGIGNVMRSLKARVVVELSIGGQAVLAPMVLEHVEDEVGGDALARPGCDEPAMQRHSVERMGVACVNDIGVFLLKKRDVFDDVEGIEFALAAHEIGKIPAGRRGGATNAATGVEHAVPGENAADGSHRRQRRQWLFVKVPMNGLGAELAQSAVLLQIASRIQDEGFDVRRHASGSRGRGGTIIEINAVQALPLGPLNPALHGSQRDAEASSHGTQGQAIADQANDVKTAALQGVFWPWDVSPGEREKCRGRGDRRGGGGAATPVGLRPPSVAAPPAPAKTRCTVTPMYWQPGDSHVLTVVAKPWAWHPAWRFV